MGSEQREGIRRLVRQGARMVGVDGSPLGPCMMADVSATGARLLLPNSDAVPAEFVLLLSHDGQLRRRCSVMWQSEKTVGIRFVFNSPAKGR